MNEILNSLLSRRSVRSYTDEQVPDDLLDQVLTAGLYAASGMNTQGCVAVAVRDKETRDLLSKLNAAVMGSDSDPFYGAPCVIVVLGDPTVYGGWIYDGSLVMGNLMLAAHAMGVGSCWIHRAREVFDTDEGKAILRDLGIEGDYEGVGNCILGYTEGEEPQAKPRKENWVYWAE